MAGDVSSGLLIIGDEILSGRTQDKNTSYIATWLNEMGIQLKEVRVVPDDQQEIADALNAMRARYTYMFTTGGIGPTHDDITAESVAYAFGVPVEKHPEAYARLLAYYGEENFTPARQLMTRVPEGGVLVDNPVSIAPGFQLENVFVLAGVPQVMQAMLEQIRPRLKGGRKVWSQSVTIHGPESALAGDLADIQASFPDVSIGSYPFYHAGHGGAQIVARGPELEAISVVMAQVVNMAKKLNYRFEQPSDLA